jgi:glyoxylase I family protein
MPGKRERRDQGLQLRSAGDYLLPMIEITGIDHIVLRARDPEALIAFYTGALGLTVEKVQARIGLTQLRAGTSLIDIVAVDGPLGRMGGAAPGAEGRNLDHFCLTVRGFDLERVKAHLIAHGVTPGDEGLRYGAGGEGLSIYLTDPEGNGLELRG